MGGKSRKTGGTSKQLIDRIKNKLPATKKPVLKEKKDGGLIRDIS